jgi:hypothetical protein
MSEEDLIAAANRYEELLEEATEKDYKHGWVFHALAEEFGEEIAKEIWCVEDDPNYEEK